MIVKLIKTDPTYKVAGWGKVLFVGKLVDCHLFIDNRKYVIGRDVIITEYTISTKSKL